MGGNKRGWKGSEAKVGQAKRWKTEGGSKWGKRESPNKRGKKIYGGYLMKEADIKFDESWVKGKRWRDATYSSEACLQLLYFLHIYYCPLMFGKKHPILGVWGSGRPINSPHSSLIYASGSGSSMLEYGMIAILNTAQPSVQFSSAQP